MPSEALASAPPPAAGRNAYAHESELVQAVIDLVYPVWSRQGSWPTVQWVDLQLRRARLIEPNTSATLVVRNIGPDCFQDPRSLAPQQPLQLTVDGLAHCAEARALELPLFVLLLRALWTRHSEFTPPATRHEQLSVTRRDLETVICSIGSDDPHGARWADLIKDAQTYPVDDPSDVAWVKLYELLVLDSRISSGGSRPDVYGSLSLVISDDIVRYWQVDTIDEYLRARDEAPSIPYAAHPAQAPTANLAANDPPEEPDLRNKIKQRQLFLVHGHNHALLREIELWALRAVTAKVVILMDQPDEGRTLVEKFEGAASQSDYMIVLLTADDHGAVRESVATDDDALAAARRLKPRARQNAILELGYAFGKLGRRHVAVVYEADVERPSDIEGICYIPTADWKSRLARELHAAGFSVAPGQ